MEQDRVQEIIENMLRSLAVSFRTVDRHESHAHPMYHIATDDAALLIGAHGENLKALNYIVKRIVERELGEDRAHFLLDVNGYQRKRIESIEREARILAERARTFKSDVEMSPMNAYERMLVHNLFANDPDVTTESVGIGKNRHVVFHCRSSYEREESSDSLLMKE